MNLSRQLNLRRDSNLSTTYRWVPQGPPPLSLYTGGLIWGHATHVPLPSRECKSGAGLWEVLQLDGSYDLDEHLKTPKVSWLQPERLLTVHRLYWGYWDGDAWPPARSIPCVLTPPSPLPSTRPISKNS